MSKIISTAILLFIGALSGLGVGICLAFITMGIGQLLIEWLPKILPYIATGVCLLTMFCVMSAFVSLEDES